LTFVHLRTGEYAEALRRIADALTLDRAGTYRDRLLQTQAEVLAQLTQRYQQESGRMTDRISTRPEPLKPARTAGDATGKEDVKPRQGNSAHMAGSRPAGEGAGRQVQ
jgi:hypothetical protein